MHASPPADLSQHDTYFIVAHIHYVLIGGSILALFAGIYYWFPKMSGRMMNETLGKWNFWTFVIVFNLTFMPMHWTGLLGMPRRVYTYGAELGVTELNQISTIGAHRPGLLGPAVRGQPLRQPALAARSRRTTRGTAPRSSGRSRRRRRSTTSRASRRSTRATPGGR